jgi:hypothetical protein
MPLVAVEYPVTRLISSTNEADQFLYPALNNRGDVAFTGRFDGNRLSQGVFLVRGGTVQQLDQRPSLRAVVHSMSINDNAQVLYRFTQDSTDSLFTTAPSAPVTTVADNSGPFDRFGFFSRLHFITPTGAPAFEAILDDGSYGLYKGGDPVADRIVDFSGPLTLISLQSARPDGTILFRGTNKATGDVGIYKGPDPASDLVLNLGKSFSAVNYYQENARGDIVFTGNGDIFTGTDPIADLFAGRAGPYQNFTNVELNELGTIAFHASLDAGGTVTFARMYEGGLNDRNEIAVSYTLQSGEAGIAVVTVPEPGTAVLSAVAVAWVLRRPRRQASMI